MLVSIKTIIIAVTGRSDKTIRRFSANNSGKWPLIIPKKRLIVMRLVHTPPGFALEGNNVNALFAGIIVVTVLNMASS